MTSYEAECLRCGSKMTTAALAESVRWNREHDAKCPGATVLPIEPRECSHCGSRNIAELTPDHEWECHDCGESFDVGPA